MKKVDDVLSKAEKAIKGFKGETKETLLRILNHVKKHKYSYGIFIGVGVFLWWVFSEEE